MILDEYQLLKTKIRWFSWLATTLRGVKAILLSGSRGSFTVDEKITQSSTGAVGRVVEYDSTNKILYYIQTRFNNFGLDTNGNLTAFSGTNTITGSDSGATGTSSSTSTVDSVFVHFRLCGI